MAHLSCVALQIIIERSLYINTALSGYNYCFQHSLLLHLLHFMVFLYYWKLVDLPSHVRSAGWLHGPLLLPWLHLCSSASCFVGHSPGKLCYPAVLMG